MKKLIIQICLFIVIVCLGYMCYQSISVPQQFTKIKEVRYKAIVQKLKDIRSAQEAYKSVNYKYTHSFDSLISFIKYDSMKVVRSLGSLSDDDIENGITEATAIKMGKIIRDTVKVSALTNVFSADYPIDNLAIVPFTDQKYKFKMGATSIMTTSGLMAPVFEAKISNMEIFDNIRDTYDELLLQENGEKLRLNKYPGLKVGDIKELNNNVGNWE